MSTNQNIAGLRRLLDRIEELDKEKNAVMDAIVRAARDVVQEPDGSSPPLGLPRMRQIIHGESADFPLPGGREIPPSPPQPDPGLTKSGKPRKRRAYLRRTKEEIAKGVPAGTLPRLMKAKPNKNHNIDPVRDLNTGTGTRGGQPPAEPDFGDQLDKSLPAGNQGAVQELVANGTAGEVQKLLNEGMNTVQVATELHLRLKTVNELISEGAVIVPRSRDDE